jgi:hypothetical protein
MVAIWKWSRVVLVALLFRRTVCNDYHAGMRLQWAIVTLFLCTALHGEPSGQGQMVETSTSRGVILTHWPYKDDARQGYKVTYWTPSPALIITAEKALARIKEEIRVTTPLGGFHSHDYYTPKYYSRDREWPIAAIAYDEQYNLILDYADEVLPSTPREYIGITVNGEKVLYMHFLELKYGAVLYFGVATGKFAVYIFGEIEDR